MGYRRSFAALLLLALPGCVVAVGNSTSTPPAYFFPGPGTITGDEISASGSLQSEANRKTQLLGIAARPGLAPAEQTHLVNIAMNHLDSDADKKTVLLALITNPNFSNEGKKTIFYYIPKFSSDSNRVTLMEAMRNRPAAPPPT